MNRHIISPAVFWHDDRLRYLNVSSRFAAIVRRVGRAAEKAAKASGKQATFRRFRFHDLRHLYAIRYLRDGGSVYDLQIILGHTSIATTEIYLDYLTPDEQNYAKGPAQIATV